MRTTGTKKQKIQVALGRYADQAGDAAREAWFDRYMGDLNAQCRRNGVKDTAEKHGIPECTLNSRVNAYDNLLLATYATAYKNAPGPEGK